MTALDVASAIGAPGRSAPRRPAVRPNPSRRPALGRDVAIVVALAATTGATIMPGAPTGLAGADTVLRATLAAAVALFASHARRWSLVVTAAASFLLTASIGGHAAAAIAVLAAFAGTWTRRHRALGAVIGTAATLALTQQGAGDAVAIAHQRVGGGVGASAVATALALGPVAISGWRGAPRSVRRAAWRTLATSAAFVVVATAGAAYALVSARTALRDAVSATDAVESALRRDDQAAAQAALDDAHTHLDRANRAVRAPWALPSRTIPVLGQHLRAAQVGTAEGATIAQAAAELARAVSIDDLRIRGGRIDLGVLDVAAPHLDVLAARLDRAEARLARLDSPWLAPPVRTQIDDIHDVVARLDHASTTAALAARRLPAMLGRDTPRTYVVLFTTPAESRGLGGFVGNWAELRADDGRLTVTASGRAADLNDALRSRPPQLTGPADYLARFGRYHPEQFFQDVTLSPDFPSVAQVVEQLYPAATGRPIDGVVALDPTALAAMLALTGPVRTDDGRTLDAAHLVDDLVTRQYLAYDDNQARKDALAEASDAVLAALLGGARPGPRQLADAFAPIVRDRRLVAHVVDPDAARLVQAVGIDGALPALDGRDGIMVVHQNAGHNKIDAYLHREVDYAVTRDRDGTARASVRITLRNDAPTTGLPASVIGSNDQGFAPGANTMVLSVYSAMPARRATVDGVAVDVETNVEVGWRVASIAVTVPAGATVVVDVALEGRAATGADYRLVAITPPAANAEVLTTSLDGRPLVASDASIVRAPSRDLG